MENHREADPAELPRQMVEAMTDQTHATDNLAQSIDELVAELRSIRELLEAVAKKATLGGVLGSVLSRKKS